MIETKICKYKINNNLLKFFVRKYEGIIEWRYVRDEESLEKYIREVLLLKLQNKLDVNNKKNKYYYRNKKDEYSEFNYQKGKLLRDWVSYLISEKCICKSSAFQYIFLSAILKSSSYRDKKSIFLFQEKVVVQIYFLIHHQKIDGDSDICQIYLNRLSESLSKKVHWKYLSTDNKYELMKIAAKGGWCLSGENMASDYVKKFNFYFLYHNHAPQIIILISKESGKVSGSHFRHNRSSSNYEYFKCFFLRLYKNRDNHRDYVLKEGEEAIYLFFPLLIHYFNNNFNWKESKRVIDAISIYKDTECTFLSGLYDEVTKSEEYSKVLSFSKTKKVILRDKLDDKLEVAISKLFSHRILALHRIPKKVVETKTFQGFFEKVYMKKHLLKIQTSSIDYSKHKFLVDADAPRLFNVFNLSMHFVNQL
jgi:hypothetical protein